MKDITVKTAAMNNSNKPIVCKFIKLIIIFGWRRRKRDKQLIRIDKKKKIKI